MQKNKGDTAILAIESSCDETAAAVVVNGRDVKSNIISSQIALHTLYGGVVPEISSRKHIEKINQVITEAMQEAQADWADLSLIHICEDYMDAVRKIYPNAYLRLLKIKCNTLSLHDALPISQVPANGKPALRAFPGHH